ncbi:hypothetical protein STCU_03116 [Strigomonas culicis]|uniref:ADG1 protein n=1 Tax=Strigomonas culicis TaxID=28005 RepID=S9UM37_9TRYP|nr:hypothetical protein STCU_06915 [Strigomonas culicis]EPY31907.1 hypothetical protein STCU_03116 [Strigomonas culicis]|eukprot:EPY24966.1 hypothetical protein STCU_06915 [Strigomonas culicis]
MDAFSTLYHSVFIPMKKYPTLGLTVGTGFLCMLTYWYYSASTRNKLLASQRECHQIAEKAFQDCRDMLKNAEQTWLADSRARDAEVRRLELQNVEQTRSVARLESAMKMCLIQETK